MKKEIDQQDLRFWRENSYLVFPELLKNKVSDLDLWIREVESWPEDFSKWLKFYEMNDPTKLSRIENFVPFHAGFSDLLLKGVLADLISELMGEDAILYKERINFKAPGGGAHAAHQDGVAYESGSLAKFSPDSVPYISVLIGVDKATKENGCFQVVKDWPLDKLDILQMERTLPDNPSFSKIAQHIEDSLPWKMIETEPGDVIVFTERLPHRSEANHSKSGRRILYGVYNPKSEGDKREKYYQDKRTNINDARYMVGNPHAPTVIK